MSKAAVNPRRVPRTQADVDRAFKAGQDAAIEVMLTLSCYALKDKCCAPDDFVHRFADAVSDVCDSISRGYVSYADIVRDLRETHDWKVNWRKTVRIREGVRVG